MHHAKHARPYYTGSPHHPHHHPQPHGGHHGFCHVCCHPRSNCCCAARDCRKEAKELLVQPDQNLGQDTFKTEAAVSQLTFMAPFVIKEAREAAGAAAGSDVKAKRVRLDLASSATRLRAGLGKAFIGGGCCVHLSIEYTPTAASSNVPSAVLVMVQDSEDTVLAWLKTTPAGSGYHVKEGIVTTKPGAHLTVLVVNMTARVRWCEIFSC